MAPINPISTTSIQHTAPIIKDVRLGPPTTTGNERYWHGTLCTTLLETSEVVIIHGSTRRKQDIQPHLKRLLHTELVRIKAQWATEGEKGAVEGVPEKGKGKERVESEKIEKEESKGEQRADLREAEKVKWDVWEERRLAREQKLREERAEKEAAEKLRPREEIARNTNGRDGGQRKRNAARSGNEVFCPWRERDRTVDDVHRQNRRAQMITWIQNLVEAERPPVPTISYEELGSDFSESVTVFLEVPFNFEGSEDFEDEEARRRLEEAGVVFDGPVAQIFV